MSQHYSFIRRAKRQNHQHAREKAEQPGLLYTESGNAELQSFGGK